jgi:ABC-2 type transport system permease protein
MKAGFLIDFLVLKNSQKQLLITALIVTIGVSLAVGSPLMMFCMFTAMVPMMSIFTGLAYDERNGWEMYRMALPISRHQVVMGRYLNLIVSSFISFVIMFAMIWLLSIIVSIIPFPQVISDTFATDSEGFLVLAVAGVSVMCLLLLVSAVVLPITFRFGMTRATRILPVILVIIPVVSVSALSSAGFDVSAAFPGIMNLFFSAEGNFIVGAVLWGLIVAVVAVLVICFLSFLIAARLYEGREL